MKTSRSRRDDEHLHQKALIEWCRLSAPREPRLARIYAIPNGRGRTKAEAGKLKAEGVRAGVLDLCLPVPGMVAGKVYHALYIEMKAGDNKLTEEQEREVSLLHADGNYTITAWNWVDAARIIVIYLNAQRYLHV